MPLTVLLGDYGSGKTTTAKYLAKQANGVYLDIDIFTHGNGASSNITLLEKLKDVITPSVEYYMDGFPSDSVYGSINEETLGDKVSYIVCLTSPKQLIERQQKKTSIMTDLPRSYNNINRITYMIASLALTFDDNPIFADTTSQPPIFYNKTDWLSLLAELNIYDSFKHVGEYQDIELNRRTFTGLSKSYKTWERLTELVDFKDKSVIDYGCNYGYFCFKAEQSGARSVSGIDEARSVIDLAVAIAIIKNSTVTFIHHNLYNFLPAKVDIILALNTLHHLEFNQAVIQRIFNQAATVVFEIPMNDIDKINVHAIRYGFKDPMFVSSHRLGRVIVVYSKQQKIIVPKKFKYHQKRTAFLKWFYHHAIKLLQSENVIIKKIKTIGRKLV